MLHTLTQFRFVKNVKLTANWASSAHNFLLAKMASEVQKPLAKMDFLLPVVSG